jgi:hypothetical protein
MYAISQGDFDLRTEFPGGETHPTHTTLSGHIQSHRSKQSSAISVTGANLPDGMVMLPSRTASAARTEFAYKLTNSTARPTETPRCRYSRNLPSRGLGTKSQSHGIYKRLFVDSHIVAAVSTAMVAGFVYEWG